MRTSFKFILYFLLLLLVLGTVGLFLGKDPVADNLYKSAGLDLTVSTSTVVATDKLNFDYLKSPALTPLVNQVINFNFDNICWRPDGFKPAVFVSSPADNADPAASSTEGNIESPIDICRLGNGAPFIVKKAK
ncbi:MAG: hypothetical protein WC863_01010 [Patescibacteria group bacterium]